MLVFRSHDEVPEGITCSTLIGLAQEWVAINTAAEYHHQVSRFGFEGCLRPGDIVDLIDRSPREVQNQMLHTLITHDTYLSSRILLQALLPKLLGIARSRASYSASLDDHLQGIISDLWQAISEYPVHRITHVAMNLIGMARRAFQPVGEPHRELNEMTVTQAVLHEDTPQDHQQQLQELFDAGLRQGTVTTEELELLTEVYLEGVSSAEAAAKRNLTGPNVRKRCERIRGRLASVAG